MGQGTRWGARWSGDVGEPGVAAVGAGVGDGGAVGAGQGGAPAGPRVAGGGAEQAGDLLGVEQAPAAGLAGGVRPAEEGAGRDQEVDQGGQRDRVAARRAGGVVVGGLVVAGVAGTPARPGAGAGLPGTAAAVRAVTGAVRARPGRSDVAGLAAAGIVGAGLCWAAAVAAGRGGGSGV